MSRDNYPHYYTLFIRDPEDGTWSPQFGDTIRACVVQEKRDTYHGLKGHIWHTEYLPDNAETFAYAATIEG